MKNEKILNQIPEKLEKIREITPLTECITNIVTVNDCANAVLAIGGSPVMTEESEEIEDFVKISDVVVINIGTTNKNQIKAMKIAAECANKINTPVVIDPVGVGIGDLRNNIVLDLLKFNIAAIRGNMSEIKAIAKLKGILDDNNTAKGVDVCLDDVVSEENLNENGELIKTLADKLNTVIIASGKIDIISDGKTTIAIKNGDDMMPLITGSGCMLTSILGTCISVGDVLAGSLIAILAMNIAGEKARAKVDELDLGTGSFRTFLIDYLSKTDSNELISKGDIVIL